MRRTHLVALLCLSTTGLTSAQDAWNPGDLYPTLTFHKWTYRCSTNEEVQEQRFVVISRREIINGEPCLRLEGSIKNTNVISEHIAVRKDGIYRRKHEFIDIEPHLCICKLPVKPGETWKVNYSVDKKAATAKFEASVESLQVLNVNYTKTVVVRAEIGDDKSKVTTTTWYAPKVGMVKQLVEDGKNVVLLELEKFERAPTPPMLP